MHLILILSCVMVFAVVPSYWLYRKWRLIQLETCAREWNPPLSEDEPDNPFALDRRLIGFSLPETRLTMQEAGEGLAMMTCALPSVHDLLDRPLPPPRLDLQWIDCTCGNTPAFCQKRGCRKWRQELYAKGEITEQQAFPELIGSFVKQEPLHDLLMECEMIDSML